MSLTSFAAVGASRRRSRGAFADPAVGPSRGRGGVRLWGPIVGALALTWASQAKAQDDGRIAAQLTCPARTGPGRVVCELTVTAPPSRLLSWVDALIVEAPDFARPLRARVAGRVPEEGAGRVVLALPLLATAENTGTLSVRARAVSCPAEGRAAEARAAEGRAACLPSSRVVSAPVAVMGPPAAGSDG